MRRVAAALLALALQGALATTAPVLTLPEQARKAEVIVRARLGTAGTVTEGTVTYVVYPLTVTETIAGDAGSLPQQDGRPALYFLQGLGDLPTMAAGQEAVLLLYRSRLDSPLVGFNQGLYPIVNGQVTPPTLPGQPAGTPTAATITPEGRTASAGTTPGSTTPGNTAVGGTPVGSAATGSVATGTAAPGTTPAGTTAPGATTAGPAPAGTAPAATGTTPASAAAAPAATVTAPLTTSTTAPFDPAWRDPAKFREAILAARVSK